MTNFADRLIARGAGQPTGFPLLKARPAARFEQEMAPQVEAEPPAEQRSETPAQPSAVSRKTSHRPVTIKETRQARSDKLAAPADGITRDVGPPPASEPPSSPARSLLRTTKISSREAEKLDQSETPASEAPISRPLSIEHPEVPHDQRPMFFDLPPITPPVATVMPPVESAPPPPSISIGRIDVQFLPPERPAAPARPEPRRTRGFETYTRARRGEPR